MNIILNKSICLKALCAFIFMASIVYAATPSISGDFTKRRIITGAKIFRALLAADVDINQKTGSSGNLKFCLLYVNNADNAEKAAQILQSRDDSRIRKLDIIIEILPFADCVKDKTDGFAGVFLTQALSDKKLKLLINYVGEKKTILFSPLEGDVERGVQSGIAVEARVRPYLNIKALHNANIRLKHFFIKVSKIYEE